MDGIHRPGYDVAALWLNMVKILIGLVFIYQDTLGTQLKMNMFEKAFYVFSAAADGVDATDRLPQELTQADPNFQVAVLPLSITEKYSRVEFEVDQIALEGGSENLLSLAARERGENRQSGLWPKDENDHALKVYRFNFLRLIDGEPASGLYEVRYSLKFLGRNADGREVTRYCWPEDYEPCRQDDRLTGETALRFSQESKGAPLDDNTVHIRYRRPTTESYGDIPIVQCQSARFPSGLRGKWLTVSQLRRVSSGGATTEVAGIEVQNREMIFRDRSRLPYDSQDYSANYYETEGAYPAIRFEGFSGNQVRGTVDVEGRQRPVIVDISDLSAEVRRRFESQQDDLYFTVNAEIPDRFWESTELRLKARAVEFRDAPIVPFRLFFVVQRNLPPRFVFPGDPLTVYYPSDVYHTRLGESEKYSYFFLGNLVVDPDREDGGLSPQSVMILPGSSKNFSITRDPLTRQFRLRIRNASQIKDGDQVSLRVSDGCWSLRLTILLQIIR